MKNLLLSSLVIISLFATNCDVMSKYGLKPDKVERTQVLDSISFLFPAFEKEKGLFKTTMKIFGREFGGILFVKKTEKYTNRLVLLSEVGMNFFDFKYQNDTMKVVSVADFLNKKVLINALKKDFELIVNENPNKNQIRSFINKKSGLRAYKKNNNIYLFDNRNELQQIENSAVRIKKEHKKIIIKHKKVKFSIELKELEMIKK